MVYGVGSDVYGVGRLGSGLRSWALNAFLLFMLLCPRKSRNVNCEQGCKVNSILKKLSLNGWRGVPPHKLTRAHNNIKSERLILQQNVCYIKVIRWSIFIVYHTHFM